jgi:hypothetical protein
MAVSSGETADQLGEQHLMSGLPWVLLKRRRAGEVWGAGDIQPCGCAFVPLKDRQRQRAAALAASGGEWRGKRLGGARSYRALRSESGAIRGTAYGRWPWAK